MKIAQLCSVYRQVSEESPYGVHNLVGNLCNSLVKKGHEVGLFSAGDAETLAKVHATVPTHAALRGASESEILRENLATTSLCFSQATKFDIIHDHFSLIGCFFAPLVATTTLHSVHIPVSPETLPHLLKFKKEKFISFSLAQREQLPMLNWVANIYHGIDTKIYAFNKTGGEYLLYLGRITKEKGVHHAIAVAKATNTPLLIAGISNPDETYWSNEIEPHIDGKLIRYIGRADLKQKIDLMQNAKALLFPTLAKETFGLVMIEAMSCGTPVIAFDNGAVSEVVQDGETGYVVKTEKQMAVAVKKIGKISRQATRDRAEKLFSIEKMTKGYEKVYQRYIK